MDYIYFDLDTARQILPWLKERLLKLKEIKYNTEEVLVNGNKKEIEKYILNVDKIIKEITKKGVIIRDPDLGLVDFPAIINDRPAYLCWKIDEEDIKFWHYAEEGYIGRKPITGKENILSFL